MEGLKDFEIKIASVQEELAQKRQELEKFEAAIKSLEQPVAMVIGSTPSQTMIEIIGNATSEEERDQRLTVAKNAAETHRQEINKLEKAYTKLLYAQRIAEKQLVWERDYQPHCERLRREWTRPPKVEQKILKCLSSMERAREAKERLEKELASWTPERQRQEEISWGSKVNPHYLCKRVKKSN